ncbi:hypothetical protein H4582DRAFT_2065662 [Lactarius indigo]|nr:hypothetical protein H4582DRAFT_2065662 [Lactarius indigo]
MIETLQLPLIGQCGYLSHTVVTQGSGQPMSPHDYLGHEVAIYWLRNVRPAQNNITTTLTYDRSRQQWRCRETQSPKSELLYLVQKRSTMAMCRRDILQFVAFKAHGYMFSILKEWSFTFAHHVKSLSCVVTGYLWGIWPHRRIVHTFHRISPLCKDIVSPPYVDIEGAFFLPRASPPQVFDTFMRIAGYKILVTGYLNFKNHSFPNPNLKRDFPLIPWKGEIAVLFIGKRKPYVSRAPPRSLLRFAIAQMLISVSIQIHGVTGPAEE